MPPLCRKLRLVEPVTRELDLTRWKDVFTFDESATERIKGAFQQLFEHAAAETKSKPNFPGAYQCELWLSNPTNTSLVKLRLTLGWKFYEGDVEATLLNGTYCLTNGEFIGTQASPAIDMHGPTPGPAWKVLNSQPPFPEAGLIAILSGPIKDEALEALAQKPIAVSAADTSAG